MKKQGLFLFALVLVFGVVLNGFSAQAATPDFAVSATSVTMPSSGFGSIPFTVSSVNGYAGTVVVQCTQVSAPAGARVPSCGGGPLRALSLNADGSVTNGLTLVPYGEAVPASLTLGALLLAFGRRRTGFYLLGLIFVMVGGLVGLVGCGDGAHGMTPGTYAYAVTASDVKTNAFVSTTANVTVR